MTRAVAHGEPAELDLVTLQKAYARWAPIYDLVFGAVFDRGRRTAIAAADHVGGRILEIGVGTGISLPGYSPRVASSGSIFPRRCCAKRKGGWRICA